MDENRSPDTWLSLLFRRNEFRSTLWGLVLLAIVFYLLSNLPEFFKPQEERAEYLSDVIKTDFEKNQGKGLRDILKKELIHSERTSIFKELLIHLAIAFGVAAVIIIAVESIAALKRSQETEEYIQRTKSQMDEYIEKTNSNIIEYRNNVAKDVWQAIFGRLIPPKIIEELESVLKLSVVRENCRYTLTIKPPYEGMADDSIVLRREITFNLKNITNQKVSHPLRVSVFSEFEDLNTTDHEGHPVAVPGHRVLTIDGKEPPGGINSVLKNDERGRLRNLETTIDLEKNKSVSVYQCVEEQARIRDKNIYVQLVPTEGLTVIIRNDYRQRVIVTRVSLHHPNYKEFLHERDDVYYYNGGILPGQSFVLGWQPREESEEVQRER